MFDIAYLPTEIIDLIAIYAERDDLKALRLTNSFFLNATTKVLYKEIHISQNSRSFDRAFEVAESPKLHSLVKSLVYHLGTLGEVYSGFEAFRHEYYSTRRRPNSSDVYDPTKITADVLWCYSCWLEEIDGENTFSSIRDEAYELRRLCEQLPHLDSIATVLDDVDPFSEPTDYIGKRTGMHLSNFTNDIHFARLFAASSEKPLHKVSGRSISWRDLRTLQLNQSVALKQRLGQLKFLELGLYNAENEHDTVSWEEEKRLTQIEALDALGAVLDSAKFLTTLKLDFVELPYESAVDEMLPVSRTIFRHHWPILQKLKLEAICADECELLNFLTAHKASLRELQLGDIELANSLETRASVLRLFNGVRKSLRLRTCTITGNFTNRLDQAWYVDTECEQPECIREQLEIYMCNSSSRAATNELTSLYARRWVENSELELEFENFCDESWQWCPELLEEAD
ncbi:hypothetical protein H2198_001515 [Neophaeococcomyces mojaviensis]|uniref:Uncharacterized protein n=1 Tax=Neophaeococcomyces mojaviensis TaxID=3383035 RepID=A0ACC3AGY5_9EURO|nr:hypothetical protein H2198_001515 [Knufia sp. JES_112]